MQRELADHEDRGAHVAGRAFIVEDAQPPRLGRHRANLSLAIAVPDAREHQQAGAGSSASTSPSTVTLASVTRVMTTRMDNVSMPSSPPRANGLAL